MVGSIAVTGTIELDGTVGAIGGLRQKASAVAQAGVDVFIVPAAQGEDDIAAARRAGGDDLEIITVATIEDALAVLEALGGDPIPPPPRPRRLNHRSIRPIATLGVPGRLRSVVWLPRSRDQTLRRPRRWPRRASPRLAAGSTRTRCGPS